MKKIILLISSLYIAFCIGNPVFSHNQNKSISNSKIIKKKMEKLTLAVAKITDKTNIDKDNYLSDSLTEAIIIKLNEKKQSKFVVTEKSITDSQFVKSGLKEINHSDVLKFNKYLNADLVLIGNVSVSDNVLKLQMELVNGQTGKIVNTFTETGNSEHEVFIVASRISDKISSYLNK